MNDTAFATSERYRLRRNKADAPVSLRRQKKSTSLPSVMVYSYTSRPGASVVTMERTESLGEPLVAHNVPMHAPTHSKTRNHSNSAQSCANQVSGEPITDKIRVIN